MRKLDSNGDGGEYTITNEEEGPYSRIPAPFHYYLPFFQDRKTSLFEAYLESGLF